MASRPALKLIDGDRDRAGCPLPQAVAFARALARRDIAAIMTGKGIDSREGK